MCVAENCVTLVFSIFCLDSKSRDFKQIKLCAEKKNKLDATEWFIALIICSIYFGHFYAHHQELQAICVLLPPMVCDALFAGCWRAGAGQPAMLWG